MANEKQQVSIRGLGSAQSLCPGTSGAGRGEKHFKQVQSGGIYFR